MIRAFLVLLLLTQAQHVPFPSVTYKEVPTLQVSDFKFESTANPSIHTIQNALFVDLVKLNNAQVDAILTKYKVQVSEATTADGQQGRQIFPRP